MFIFSMGITKNLCKFIYFGYNIGKK